MMRKCILTGMLIFSDRLHFAALSLLLVLSGCAVQDTFRSERYFWPQPPDKPRIEWLSGYHSQLDLRMTSWRRIKETLVGEDTAIVLKKPVEVRSDSRHDKVYIADLEAAAVFVFDFQEPELRLLSMAATGLTGSVKPVGLALDGNDNLYVLEPRYRKILVFNYSEQFLRAIDLQETRRPLALALDKKLQRLYVSDAELSKIFVFDLNGQLLSSFGGPGDAAGQLNRPVSMAVNSNGELLVAEAFNARIQIFDRQGKFVRTFGARGTGDADFQLIKGVAVDSDDNVYVVDGRSNSIKIFNQSGDLLLAFGGFFVVTGSGKAAPGGFALPVGIDIDARDRMYVVDQLNARLQVFQYLSDKSPNPSLRVPVEAK